MGETINVFQKTITKQGNEVTPLDYPRSIDSGRVTIISGAFDTSGIAYTVGSGKLCWIRQITISELSGEEGETTAVTLATKDLSGTFQPVYPPIALAESNDTSGRQKTRVIDTCLRCADVSGQQVAVYSGGAKLYGDVGVVVQIDPKIRE